jgi:hypothetical protein
MIHAHANHHRCVSNKYSIHASFKLPGSIFSNQNIGEESITGVPTNVPLHNIHHLLHLLASLK